MILFLLHLPNLTQQHDEMKKVFIEILVKLFSKPLTFYMVGVGGGGGEVCYKESPQKQECGDET